MPLVDKVVPDVLQTGEHRHLMMYIADPMRMCPAVQTAVQLRTTKVACEMTVASCDCGHHGSVAVALGSCKMPKNGNRGQEFLRVSGRARCACTGFPMGQDVNALTSEDLRHRDVRGKSRSKSMLDQDVRLVYAGTTSGRPGRRKEGVNKRGKGTMLQSFR